MAGFTMRVALVGNPVRPDIPFDTGSLRRLKALGFNTVQLNIAWGCRPGDEPLNLEDILSPTDEPDERQRRWFDEIARRAALARAEGLRTIFHFGAPRVTTHLYQILSDPAATDRETEENSPCKEEIIRKYESMITRLADRIPQVDDILMYTFDQEAWVGNEFGNDATASGVSLHRRILPFLQRMTACWAAKRPEGRLWWEPWEISAGSIYTLLPQLPDEHFGLMLHSNIAEVQKANPADRWLRNMVLLAGDRNIPICGEVFLTGATEEVEPLQHAFAPALVWEEIRRLQDLGLYGIKEYFGTRPDMMADLDIEMAGICFHDPQLSEEQALQQLAARWPQAKALPAAMHAAQRALTLFPWDLSWRWRAINRNHTAWHGYAAWNAPGVVAISPSWKSTRRAVFMLTEDEEAHEPWLIEDISLRCAAAARYMKQAAAAFHEAAAQCDEHSFEAAAQDYTRFAAVTMDESLHGEETLCAIDIRHAAAKGEVPQQLLERMRAALQADVENQKVSAAVATDVVSPAPTALAAFEADPIGWSVAHF